MRSDSITRLKRLFLAGLVLSGVSLFGQDPAAQIAITGIQRNVHKKWIFIPDKVDYAVSWSTQVRQGEVWSPADPERYTYRVTCQPAEGDPFVSKPVTGGRYEFKGLAAGQAYAFTVEALRDGLPVAESESARDMVGRRGGEESNNDILRSGEDEFTAVYWFEKYLPISGRWAYAWRVSIYDSSSPVGRACFWLLWWCWLAGLYLIFFRCIPILKFQKIFPMRPVKSLAVLKDLKKNYAARISPEFTSILERWKQIIDSSNWSIREFIGKKRGQFESSTVDISGASVKYWSDRGSAEVRKLIDEIAHKNLDRYPTVRVFKAGLENHETGGFRWMDVSKEVEASIENQAASELEVLKRDSVYDFLWNLGTVTPLLGLLGTVTGISKSFDDLAKLPDNATQKQLIHQLAGGIHEALWTTIEGLIFGITFMLIYYYYQKKLEWIYSKWEEDYVYVIERL
jgi:biopolymer transport protein ExbB/TolQ